MVPQTWDCGFTAGWGSSVGWGGSGKGMQGKLVGSESRRRVHPLQKTSRTQSLAFSRSQPVSHTSDCVIPLRYQLVIHLGNAGRAVSNGEQSLD